MRLIDPFSCLNPIHHRHGDIHNHHIRRIAVNRVNHFPAIARLANNGEISLSPLEQQTQTLP